MGIKSALLALSASLALLQTALCGGQEKILWITYESPDGETLYLQDNRRPSLYTGNYGDCLGNSLVNVTRFDAAYYKDNMTVLFHLAGDTALQNESLVMYIGVYAYGESRFDLTFNPCHANIESLCPLNSSVPISANGIIPVSESDVSNIPSLALSIPDFEGQAVLRIFANSTQSEIGCYSAVITNGHSFAQPKSVGGMLRAFSLIAMVSSCATAIYGEAIPTMRLHYAHSPSVGVVFAVFQHIFFTGAMSMNWPSVLVAWWRNFAWSGGMIHNANMQSSIDRLTGNAIGNASQVGAAWITSGNNNVGGGYDISQIYKRTSAPSVQVPYNHPIARDLAVEIYRAEYEFGVHRRELLLSAALQPRFEHALQARDYLANKTEGYRWYGHAIGSGMPLPGNYSGFPGTLAQENISFRNAFATGFFWFLILLALLVGVIVAFKWVLEALFKIKVIRQDRLGFFRKHWLAYVVILALRTCYLGFFLIIFLTIFEFSFQSSVYVKVLAAFVFFVFAIGIPGVAAYACYYKKHLVETDPDMPVEHNKLLGVIRWTILKNTTAGTVNDKPAQNQSNQERVSRGSQTPVISPDEDSKSQKMAFNIHDNDTYIMKFGWLASRFKRTQWWFFTACLFYEFVRAVFYAGTSSHPLVQVFGLLIVESLAFAYIVWAKPFEGRRLNILVVYCLGFSKVASVALSAAFDVRFNLPRTTATIVGIAIIAIQGILTIVTLISIVVGAISSYMSLSRNREDFRPRKWHGLREKYFGHLDLVVNDLPLERKIKKSSNRSSVQAGEQKSGFEMKSMRRVAKIEDEDVEFASEMRTQYTNASNFGLDDRTTTPVNTSDTVIDTRTSETTTPTARSRAGSVQRLGQSNLPPGARPYKPSWSARDFVDPGPSTRDPVRYRSISMEASELGEQTATSLATSGAASERASFVQHVSNSRSLLLPQDSTELMNRRGNISPSDTIDVETSRKLQAGFF